MKTWVVIMVNNSEPEHKVYLVGIHSNKDAANRHANDLANDRVNNLQVVEMNMDDRQPPVLVGMAPPEDLKDCKKNTPNGF
jgi:hypothetical protein